MKEEIILDITIEDADNEQQVDNLTKRIAMLQAETAELVRQNKELVATGKTNSKEFLENTKQVEINKQRIAENSASRKGLVQTLIAEDSSIKALSVRNKELIKQRDLISTKTNEGRARIAEINKELDENTAIIIANSSALERQRFNIGNYGSALDKLLPSISNTIKGTMDMYKSFITFITTFSPWVIGITAVIAALTGLFAAYKKSAQGAKDLETASAGLSGALQGITNDIASLIEKLIGEGGVTKILGNLLTTINPIIGAYYQLAVAVEKSSLAFERNKAAAEGAHKFYQEIAEINKRIAEDESQSVDKRITAANRVIELLQAGADKRKEVIEDRIRQLGRIELKTQDQVDEIAKLRKELDDLGEETTGKITPILQMIQSIREEYQKNVEAAQLAAREQRLTEMEADLLREHEAYTKRLEFEEEFRMNMEISLSKSLARVAKIRAEQRKQDQVEEEKAAKKQAEIDRYKNEAIIGGIALVTKERSAARVALNAIFKADAIKETTVNTYNAAVAAYKSLAGIPIVGPALGAVAAALVTAFGLVNIARISGIQFAKGGRADKRGTFSGPSHSGGGVTYIRQDGKHAINVEGGENFYVLNKSASREINALSNLNQAHGGRSWTDKSRAATTYARGGSIAGAIETREVNRILQQTQQVPVQQIVQPVLVLQDFEAAAAAKNEPLSRAKVV